MRKIALLVLLAMSASVFANSNDVRWIGGTGDWMVPGNWNDEDPAPDWVVPGWVVGNPANTTSSTDLRWNLSEAIIESGTANVAPSSKPDGIVADLDMGYNGGSATLNIGGDFSVGGAGTSVSIGVDSGSTGIVNMTAGVFESGCDRVWVGTGGHGLFNQTGGAVRIKRMSMADNSGSTGEYRISGGSLIVTNAISGDQDDVHAGKFTVSGSGATSIETMRIHGWSDVMRFELDAGGTTLIKCTPDAGGTYDACYADLRRALIEVDTLPDFNGVEGDVYDVLWVEDSVLTGSNDGKIRLGEPCTTLGNCSSVAEFRWRVVNKQVEGKDGQMLQIIVGSNYDSRYVDGRQKQFYITDSSQTWISGSAGIAFDPSSQGGGVYDRIYLVNSLSGTDNPKNGLYAIDTANETYSGKLMDAQGSRPYDVAVDTNGNAYVCYGYSSKVFKLIDPLGTATEVQMLGNYAGGGDDDPDGLAMAPIGFGGVYNEGADVVLFDSGLDANTVEAISVINKDSTDEFPSFDVLWATNTGSSLRMDTSDYDGSIYFTYYHPKTADLNGSERVYIVRMDNVGSMKRIFLDIPPEDVAKLDDTLAVNPVDGSVWMGFYATAEGNIRTIYRVDVANAVLAQGASDYLAPTVRVIDNVGFNNIGKNSMAISPDGKQLALVNPNSRDMIMIFDIESTPIGQVISGFSPTNQSVFFTTDTVGMSAVASSGLDVSFSLVSGPAVVNGSNVTFTSHGAVSVMAEQAGDLDYSPATPATNNWVVHGVPLVGAVSFERVAGQVFKTQAALLLENSTDPEGTELALSAVDANSASGYPVRVEGRWLMYTPPSGFSGVDSFNFTVLNQFGGVEQGVATIVVAVDEQGDGQTVNITSITSVGGGDVAIRFAGIPGRTYNVQATTNLVAPDWINLGETVIGPLGFAVYIDANAPPSRYYRTANPE